MAMANINMGINEEHICRLCLKVAKDEFRIDEVMKQMFDILLLKMDLEITRNPIICQDCMDVAKNCLNFKYTFINTEQIIVLYSAYRAEIKHDIRFIYNEREHVRTALDEDFNVCRFCMSRLERNNFASLNALMNENVFHMLSEYIVEMEFTSIENPQVCLNCKENLNGYFKFVLNCLDVEEKIIEYCKKKGTDNMGQVTLSNTRLFLFPDILEYPDKSSQTYKIDQEHTEGVFPASHDMVLSLLETPFSSRNEIEKRQILNSRPTPKISAVYNEKRRGRKTSRTFQTSWYDNHRWLCGSSYKESLYCWPCILFGIAKNSWCSKGGFRDLKNFSRSTKIHEGSREHIKNFLTLTRLQQNRTTVEEALRENDILNKILYNENVRKNRLLIDYLIDVAVTLGKQELAFRGHNETLESSNRGDFEEIFKCLIKRNQELTEHCEKFNKIFTGQSKTIQNELVFCIHEYLTDFIKNEVNDKECFFFAVIVDDFTDITEHSQCSITLRYVINGCLHERFLGIFDVSENRTADALCELLLSVLEPYSFREKLMAQCYDGASVMSGELNGLQTKIKSSAPLALFTHCCAHRLNFVLQQGAKQIDKSRIFFSTLLSIPTYFRQSPKRAFVLDKIVGKRTPRSVETSWYTRSAILSLAANERDNLILVFETIIKDKTLGPESINGANGFLKHFQDFEFAILTKIYHEIFACTDLLFQILQAKHLDMDYCCKQIKVAGQRISELRKEEKFKEFFNYAKNATGLPSKRGKSSNELKIFSSYKMLYYEIIDCIYLQLSTRFGNLHNLNFLALVDSSKFPEYINKFPEKSLECLLQMYPNVFEIDRLKSELIVLYRDEQFCNLDVQKTLEILYKEFKMIFSETYKLFCLVLTIPTTSVPVENLSCLKRIETYLRNTMAQARLTSVSMMAIEKELLQSVSAVPQFYEDITNKFANLKDRQIDLIYKN